MLVSGGTMALQEEPLFDSYENGFFPSPNSKKIQMHRTGLEPVPEANPSMVRWEASILPLNYRCSLSDGRESE